jgi:Spy/CpxP family protein refolding chaperone
MLTIATLACGLYAQMPGRPGMRGGSPPVDELKQYLALTDAQVQALQQIRQQQAQANQSTFQEMAQKRQALQTQIRAGSNDAAALGKLLIDIEALRKRVADSDDVYQAQSVAVLTADQKTRLNALVEARKLQPVIGQAASLGLLARPEGAGDGAGMRGPMGSGSFGRGMRGPGMVTPFRSPRR